MKITHFEGMNNLMNMLIPLFPNCAVGSQNNSFPKNIQCYELHSNFTVQARPASNMCAISQKKILILTPTWLPPGRHMDQYPPRKVSMNMKQVMMA